MDKISIYFAKDIEKSYKDFVTKNLKSSKFELTFIDEKNKFDDLVELAKAIQSQKTQRVITIDDFGIYPFMVMAKHKGVVVAQVSDYHSARMTIQHNNSNVLALPFKIMAKENLVDIINTYLGAHFEAGRHMVRINMLEAILEGEK